MGRPSLRTSRMRKCRAQESEKDKDERLKRNRERNKAQRLGESSEDREERLSQMRNYVQRKLTQENIEQREHRLSLTHKRLSHETVEERDHRLSLMRERLSNESAKQRVHRLSLIHERLSNQSAEQREHRLSLNRARLSKESAEQRVHRLSLIGERLANELAEQREHRLSLIRKRLANESAEQREHRLSLVHGRLSNESAEQREHRLSLARCQSAQVLLNETAEERTIRLSNMRARDNRRLANAEQFKSAIHVFADVACNICKKMIYPQQRTRLPTANLENLLPADLIALANIIVCTRCSNNIRKRKIPAQAYWNKMTVPDIPEEIAKLTEIEKRFLLRIVPFIQIIRVQNRFSQDWCRGQVVLFAKDIIELAEQLPLRPQQAGLVIVTENLENLQRSRDFQIDMAKLNQALQWLLINNALYRDVRPSFANIIDLSAITQIVDVPVNIQPESIVEPRQLNTYTNIDENVAILQGSFHQGNERFSPESRNNQCTAIATVACTAFNLLNPNAWCRSDVDYIVILGDKYYRECIVARANPDDREVNREYLAVTELLPRIIFERRAVNLCVNYEAAFNGHMENDNSSEGFPNLKNALLQFFEGNADKVGILTCNAVTVAVHCRNESEMPSYWLFDSHARGAKGCKAPSRGTACCMRFSGVEKLYAILRRNLYIPNKNHSSDSIMLNVYSLTPIIISPEIEQLENQPDEQPIIEDSAQSIQDHLSLSVHPTQSQKVNSILPRGHRETTNTDIRYVYTTNMLHTIDEGVPDLGTVISVNDHDNIETEVRLAEITRKTAPPLNLERERRMEELCWYFLFPDGKNGFGEERNISITALDYFQARVMGSEKRFQRNDYLFFALSVVEYYRAKSSVSVSCRMRQGYGERTPQGLVENMHLTMRNIRGSASYWRRCCSELIAMVRSLGAPTWFMTLSCNDLNWPDMIKALLIADGGDLCSAETLSFPERLALVQKYPVVVARQFSVRVNALMRY